MPTKKNIEDGEYISFGNIPGQVLAYGDSDLPACVLYFDYEMAEIDIPRERIRVLSDNQFRILAKWK